MFFLFMDPAGVARLQVERFAGLDKLGEFFDFARNADPFVSVTTLATFVHVVRRMPALAANELSLKDVAHEMQVPYTTFTRQLDLLAEGGGSVRPLNWLNKSVHPANRRARHVQLTAEGAEMLEKLCGFMRPDQMSPGPADSDESQSRP